MDQTAPTITFSPRFVLPLSPSPTLQLRVKTDKPPACCHMELIKRTGGNKRQFNFNTNKETFQIPPYKKHGGTRRTRSLRLFALKQIYGGPSLTRELRRNCHSRGQRAKSTQDGPTQARDQAKQVWCSWTAKQLVNIETVARARIQWRRVLFAACKQTAGLCKWWACGWSQTRHLIYI